MTYKLHYSERNREFGDTIFLLLASYILEDNLNLDQIAEEIYRNKQDLELILNTFSEFKEAIQSELTTGKRRVKAAILKVPKNILNFEIINNEIKITKITQQKAKLSAASGGEHYCTPRYKARKI